MTKNAIVLPEDRALLKELVEFHALSGRSFEPEILSAWDDLNTAGMVAVSTLGGRDFEVQPTERGIKYIRRGARK